MQLAYVGLMKAINGFDPALGFSPGTYAAPCINGEIRKHFRDKSWHVRVGRTVQERVVQVRQAEYLLTQQLGRVPTDSELASDLGIGDADIRQARQAELVLHPLSLDGPPRGPTGAASLSDLLGEEDPRLEHMLGMQAIARHWGDLPVREQQIVLLYYYRDMTQAQIGQQLGLSQMQISRLLAQALGYLRLRLFGQPEYGSEAVAPRAEPVGAEPAGAAPNPRGAASASAANGHSAPKSERPAAEDGRPEQASRLEPTAA
jgi:RNA polymerase sigma-B factor